MGIQQTVPRVSGRHQHLRAVCILHARPAGPKPRASASPRLALGFPRTLALRTQGHSESPPVM